MKLVYSFLLSICFFTSLFSQDVFFREQTEKPMPFILEFDDAEIADADNQISPQALSEEDITVILFNELDFPSNDAQEETTPEIIIISQSAPTINLIQEPIATLFEAQKHLTIETKTPEESFLQSLENFISSTNIISKETLTSCKKAKSQGKLLAKRIQDLSASLNISISQARNMAQKYIQEKCQDLHLGISNIEKNHLKNCCKLYKQLIYFYFCGDRLYLKGDHYYLLFED